MADLINPRRIKTFHQRFDSRARGEKFYRTAFELGGYTKFSARKFKTATAALDYATRVILRWMRLYDAAVVEMTSASPVSPEEAQSITAEA